MRGDSVEIVVDSGNGVLKYEIEATKAGRRGRGTPGSCPNSGGLGRDWGTRPRSPPKTFASAGRFRNALTRYASSIGRTRPSRRSSYRRSFTYPITGNF